MAELSLTLRGPGDVGLPTVDEVRSLYRLASAEPPLNEAENVADLFANLYGYAAEHEHVLCVDARVEERLVGFCLRASMVVARADRSVGR